MIIVIMKKLKFRLQYTAAALPDWDSDHKLEMWPGKLHTQRHLGDPEQRQGLNIASL